MGLMYLKIYTRSFIADESGATAVEYALLASILSIGVLFLLESIGNNISNDFMQIGNAVKSQKTNANVP